MIKLDINIGDIILVGRFKNKRIEVKEIGVDEHGNPTVNGKSILKIRIEKLMKTKKNIKEAILNKDWGELIGKTVTLIDTLVVTDFKTNKNIKLNPGDIVKIIDSARVNFDIKTDIIFIEFKGKKYVSHPEALLNKSNLNESKQFKMADIAKKILKEEGFDKDGNPYGFKYDDEYYYPKRGDTVESTFIGSDPKYKQFKNKPFIDVVTGVISPSTEPWCAINFKNHGQIKDCNDWNFVKVS